MPPRWPPMPSAQVLQAFFERMALHSLKMPPASRAFRQVYKTAGQPPPDFNFFMYDLVLSKGSESLIECKCCLASCEWA